MTKSIKTTVRAGRTITSPLSKRLRAMKKDASIIVTDRTRPVLGSILWSTQNATDFEFASTTKGVKAKAAKGCVAVKVTRVA